jgi:hypothetical protein
MHQPSFELHFSNCIIDMNLVKQSEAEVKFC